LRFGEKLPVKAEIPESPLARKAEVDLPLSELSLASNELLRPPPGLINTLNNIHPTHLSSPPMTMASDAMDVDGGDAGGDSSQKKVCD
jgi:hypothetical protein